MDLNIEFTFRGEFRYKERQIVDVDLSEDDTAVVRLNIYSNELYGTLGYSSYRPKRVNDKFEFPGEWVQSAPDHRFQDLEELDAYISELPGWESYIGLVSNAYYVWEVLFIEKHEPW